MIPQLTLREKVNMPIGTVVYWMANTIYAIQRVPDGFKILYSPDPTADFTGTIKVESEWIFWTEQSAMQYGVADCMRGVANVIEDGTAVDLKHAWERLQRFTRVLINAGYQMTRYEG